METLITKQNGKEVVEANLRFRVLMGRKLDQFRFESYNEAKKRLATLKSIFNYSRFEIVITEK